MGQIGQSRFLQISKDRLGNLLVFEVREAFNVICRFRYQSGIEVMQDWAKNLSGPEALDAAQAEIAVQCAKKISALGDRAGLEILIHALGYSSSVRVQRFHNFGEMNGNMISYPRVPHGPIIRQLSKSAIEELIEMEFKSIALLEEWLESHLLNLKYDSETQTYQSD